MAEVRLRRDEFTERPTTKVSLRLPVPGPDMASAQISEQIDIRPPLAPQIWILPAAIALGIAIVSTPTVALGSWTQFNTDSLAWTLFAAGAAFRWWSAIYRGDTHGKALLNSGPYSLCRHPMPLGSVLIGFAFALFLGSATFALGFAVAATGYYSMVVGAEERRLARMFGSEFAMYRKQVPLLWPKLRNFKAGATIVFDVTELLQELRRMTVWMWIPVIGRLLAQFRGEPWWPHFLHLP